MARNVRRVKVFLVVAALLSAPWLTGAVPISLAFLKDTVKEITFAAFGVKVDIQGSLRLRLGWHPSLSATNVTAAVPGDAGTPLVQVDNLSVSPRVFDLLRKRLHFREIESTGVAVNYCAALPARKDAAAEQPSNPALRSLGADSLRLQDVVISCSTLAGEPIRLNELTAKLPAGEGMTVALDVQAMNLPVKLLIETGSLNVLLSDPQTFTFSVEARLASARAEMNGELSSPLSTPGLQARVKVEATDTAWLAELSGARVPEMGALALEAALDISPSQATLSQARGRIGVTEFALEASAHISGERPRLQLEGDIEQLDLSPFVVGAAQSQPRKSPEPATRAASDKNLHETVGLLQSFDVHTRLRVGRLLNSPIAAENIVLRATLENGLLLIDDGHASLAGNTINASARLNTTADCPRLDVTASLSGAGLQALAGLFATDLPLTGSVRKLELNTGSCGTNLQAHKRSLSARGMVIGLAGFWGNANQPLVVEKLSVSTGWKEATSIRFSGQLLGEVVVASLDAGSIEAMLAGSDSPVAIQAEGAGATATLNGKLGLAPPNANISGASRQVLHASLRLEAPRLGTLHSWTGVDANSNFPLNLVTEILVSDTGLSIETFDAIVGDSDLSGRLQWSRQGNERNVLADIRSHRIDLRQLGSLLPATAAGDDASLQQEGGNVGETADALIKQLNRDHSLAPAWFRFPAGEIDVRIDELTGIEFEVRDIVMHAPMRRNVLDEAELTMLIEDIPLTGLISADLTGQQRLEVSVGASDVDIDRILRNFDLLQNTEMNAKRIDFNYRAVGSSIAQAARNSVLLVDIEQFSWLAQQNQEQVFHLGLDHIRLSVEPDKPTTWQMAGHLNKVPVKAWMQTPRVAVLLSKARYLRLALATGSADYVAMLDLVLDRGRPEGLAIEYLLSGDRLSASDTEFDTLKSPLAGFELKGAARANGGESFSVELSFSSGVTQAHGTVSVQRANGRRTIAAELTAPYIQTDDFVALVEDWRTAREEQVRERPEHATAGESDHSDASNLLVTITDNVETVFAQNTLDLRLTVEELHSADNFLGTAELQLHRDSQGVTLQPFKIRLPDVEVDVSYRTNVSGGAFDADLDIEVSRFKIDGLLKLLDPALDMQGLVYLEASLNTRAPSVDLYRKYLNGTFDLAFVPENLDARVLDLWATNLVLALLPTPAGLGRQKVLNCGVLRFNIKDGVMKSKNILLDSTDIIVRGRGTIDLVNRELDLLVAPQAKLERFLSLSTPMTVTGPWDDYRIDVASGSVIATLFRWTMGLIYVPYKWLTGQRFPEDGIATCYDAMGLEPPQQVSSKSR